MHQQEPKLSPVALRDAAVCLIAGSVAVAGFRAAHGDLPAGEPEAALRFITGHPFYAGVHLGTICGVLAWAAGLIVLSRSLVHPSARLLGRLGVASVLVGSAIFIVDFSVDGVAGQDLAAAWAAAPHAGQAEVVQAAGIAFSMLRGTSLTAIAILWGLPLALLGRAVVLDGYPAWLGRAGLALSAVTTAAAMALALRRDLFPGVLLYGGLVSAVQLWSIALGGAMWRRAVAASKSTPSPRRREASA